MYVAVTRARQRLYLSYAQSRMLHGQVRYGIASRFLDEIPEGLTKRLNSKPVAKTYAAGGQYTAKPGVPPVAHSSYPFKIGQSVRHGKFGEGVVVSYEGNASDLAVKINFGSAGLKTLMLEYARLEKI